MVAQSRHRSASVVVLCLLVAAFHMGAYGPSFVFGGAPRIAALPRNLRDSVAGQMPEMPAVEPSINAGSSSSASWLSTVAALVSTAAACGLVLGLGSSSPAEAAGHPEYRFLMPLPGKEVKTYSNPEKELEEAKVGLKKLDELMKLEEGQAKAKVEASVKQITNTKRGEANGADNLKGPAKDAAHKQIERKYRDMIEKVALTRDTETEAAEEKWRAARAVYTDTIKGTQAAIDQKRVAATMENDALLATAQTNREQAEDAARQKERATILNIAAANKKEGAKIEDLPFKERQAAEEQERQKKGALLEKAKAERISEEEAARKAEVQIRMSRKM